MFFEFVAMNVPAVVKSEELIFNEVRLMFASSKKLTTQKVIYSMLFLMISWILIVFVKLELEKWDSLLSITNISAYSESLAE
jgi:hypothetical protein